MSINKNHEISTLLYSITIDFPHTKFTFQSKKKNENINFFTCTGPFMYPYSNLTYSLFNIHNLFQIRYDFDRKKTDFYCYRDNFI